MAMGQEQVHKQKIHHARNVSKLYRRWWIECGQGEIPAPSLLNSIDTSTPAFNLCHCIEKCYGIPIMALLKPAKADDKQTLICFANPITL